MTIVVEETFGRQGEAQAEGERNYTRNFLATWEAADGDVTETDISLAAGCPRKFDPVGPGDPGAKCVRLSISQISKSTRLASIVARYSTKYGNEAKENEPNPLLRPVEWRYDSVRQTITLPRDARGNAYETAAGEPFASPPEKPFGTSKWTATWNVATFSDTLAEMFAWTVNSIAWKGRDPGKILCEGISADEQWENDYHFWALTTIFHIHRNGWQPVEIPNRGYRYLDGGVEKTSKTLVWLNAAGDKWTNADSEDEKYLDRYPFDEADHRLIDPRL